MCSYGHTLTTTRSCLCFEQTGNVQTAGLSECALRVLYAEHRGTSLMMKKSCPNHENVHLQHVMTAAIAGPPVVGVKDTLASRVIAAAQVHDDQAGLLHNNQV